MTAEAVFKSTHPDVLAAWDKAESDWQTYRDAVNAFRDRYPTQRVIVADLTEGRECVVGLDGDPANPPPGPWRWTLKARFVPDKRSNAGKLLAIEMKNLAYTPPPIPGQPGLIISDGLWHSCGFHVYDGVAFADWSCGYETVERNDRFDPTIWVRAKLSEYYAAVEAAEEGAKANG